MYNNFTCLIPIDAGHPVREANLYAGIITLIIIYRRLNTLIKYRAMM